MTECYWAESFPSPTYRELVKWSVQAVPWALATFIVKRYRQGVEKAGRWKRGSSWIAAFVKLVAALAFAPLFVTLLAIALILSLVPISQIQALGLAIQSKLTASVGDSMAFVKSPMRSALVRTRIVEDLKRLKARCSRTIVVAHSQGAAVVLEAMGGMADKEAPASQEEVLMHFAPSVPAQISWPI